LEFLYRQHSYNL
jgi:chromosome segregation ATPase